MHIFPLIQLTILHVSIMFPILSHYPYIVPLSINIYIDRIDIFHINPFPCTNWPDGLASHVRWASWSSPSARYDRPLPRRSCSPSWAPRTGFDGWDWDLNDEKWNINDDWWFNGDLVMLCWFYGMSLGFHLISWEFDGSWGDAGEEPTWINAACKTYLPHLTRSPHPCWIWCSLHPSENCPADTYHFDVVW